MGLIGDPDNINAMSPPPQPPPSEKASVSDAKNDTDVAKKYSVDILKDETKPTPSEVVDKNDKLNITNEKKPEIQTKPSGRHNWTKLKKAISKVRGLIALYNWLVLTLGCQRSNCEDSKRVFFCHYPASITYQNENFIKSYIWSTINQYILNMHGVIDLEIFYQECQKINIPICTTQKN